MGAQDVSNCKGEPEMVKKRSVTLVCEKDEKDMEEGKHSSKAFMPNLPTPLTLEEKKYLLAVERGDNNTVRKMLMKTHRHIGFMNKDCVDPLGRGALHMAIDNENLEMVELLVVMGVETKDALLHAIDVEFVEAVEVLLEHEEVIHKDGEPYSWEKVDRQTANFTPEITPLILAAHRDNYEILKILLDRGAMLPMPHDIRCGCDECIKSSGDDSLRHSMSRINSYRALASPSLIALSSTDPILTAFELSWELKTLAYDEQEFGTEYLELRRQCRDFAEELLSHTRSSTELAVILNYDPESPPYEEGDHMELRRLELAIDYKQKKFVAHPNVQQLLAAIWYEGLPGFRRKSVVERMVEIVKVVALFPFYCMNYMIMPESPTGKLMRTPFMKFLIHSSSYLFFLLLLILVSVRFEDLVIHLFGTEYMRKQLEEESRRQRGRLPTPLEFLVFFYVFGFIWEEILEMRSEGIQKYFKNMWNILDVMRDFLYISTILLRIGAYIQQKIEIANDPQTAYIPKEDWDTCDPQLISEGLFAAANILSALKLVHIFSINPYLGPLQISLGRMVIDIVKFFFIYSLVLFAFACGLTQLLWYYNDLEKQKCYSLPGGLPDWNKQGDACMKWRRFHNVFEASQSLFWAGFGMVGLSDFELTGIREYTRFWSMLMFGTYSVINIIVLLNLLIAMMSSSYSFIVEHADTEWKFARTKLWMSYFEEGRTLPPPFNIFPNIKHFRKYIENNEMNRKMRRMSTRTQRIKRKARDYRYLGVMRALIWRYVCSLQKRNVEDPVTEDDVNEVKGDISSLRFELIDLFEANGMDVSACSKKSKAALGRKMRMWERRLMRDFHVSPAMGGDDTHAQSAVEDIPKDDNINSAAADRFKRIAKLAMTPKVADIASAIAGKNSASQIGRTNQHDDSGRENLKKAMERARRKMEEDTPDGSPNSSRGCSPYPDLYTGPHLMDTINSLQLSPTGSAATTPMPMDGTLKPKRDDQAKDNNLLTIPGRRSSKSLEKGNIGEMTINVPSDIFSMGAIKALSKTNSKEISVPNKKEADQHHEKPNKENKTNPSVQKHPSVIVSTVSEKDPIHIKKINEKSQSKISNTPKICTDEPPTNKPELKPAANSFQVPNDIKPKPKVLDDIKKVANEGKNKPQISSKQEEPQKPNEKHPHLNERNAALATSEKILQPTSIKNENSQPALSQPVLKKDFAKPPALRIDPKIGHVIDGPPCGGIKPMHHVVSPPKVIIPPIVHSIKQPQEQTELQNMDVIRKPRLFSKQGSSDKLEDEKPVKSMAPKQPSLAAQGKTSEVLQKKTMTPEISVIPSTPAKSDSSPAIGNSMNAIKKTINDKPKSEHSMITKCDAPQIPKKGPSEESKSKDESLLKNDLPHQQKQLKEEAGTVIKTGQTMSSNINQTKSQKPPKEIENKDVYNKFEEDPKSVIVNEKQKIESDTHKTVNDISNEKLSHETKEKRTADSSYEKKAVSESKQTQSTQDKGIAAVQPKKGWL